MKISVIVPVYNVAPYIRRCVDSVLAQTHRDFELILVDDGSTDGSGRICDEYASFDRRVRVIHQINGGLSAARNAALDQLELEGGTDYVSFVDSDDWVSPDYLAELVRGLADGAEISAVRFVRTSADAVEWGCSASVGWRTVSPREFWLQVENTPAAACGKLYALRLFGGIRYPVGRINEDEFTTYRIVFRTARAAFTDKALYVYYARPGSIMNAEWSERRLDRLEAWRDQIRFFGERGFGELVVNSRECLVVDLVEAVRRLEALGLCARAKDLRRQLSEELEVGRLSVKDHYLAHKTAHPLRTRLARTLLACAGVKCR